MTTDTIAAIATPLGEGGLAVIRISGPQAISVASQCFASKGRHAVSLSQADTHTLHYGWIHRDGRHVDEVLLALMRAPRSFTCEDVIEISCHGGILPAKLVLDAVLAAGARLAHPGEFTRRAFLNGRLDLAQAEAVADLIHSRTERALESARDQLEGRLSRRINEVRDDFMDLLAHVEAHLDFPEEDIAPDTQSRLAQRLHEGIAFLNTLRRATAEGQVLRKGIRAAIIGRPNAGKSSLLNLLLDRDRSIVSHIPGTTRDTIEETANVRGIPVVFIDTAGLREARDDIEHEGIRRSRAALARADLVLLVFDGSEALSQEDDQLLHETSGRKRILVCNKADLPRNLDSTSLSGTTVAISCVTGAGIDPLKDAIQSAVWAGGVGSEMTEAMGNARHLDALNRSHAASIRALAALESDAGLELIAQDLRDATHALGEIVGKTATEDLLDRIFSEFCLGK